MDSMAHKVNDLFEAEPMLAGRIGSPALSRRLPWLLFILSLFVVDVLSIGLAFRVAYFFRFESTLRIFHLWVTPSQSFYESLVMVLIPLWIGIYAVLGLYNRDNLLSGTQEYAKTFYGATIGIILIITTGFLLPGFVLARGWLLLAWGFAFVFNATGRFFIRRSVYLLRQRGYFLAPAVILGTNEEARSLAEQLVTWKSSGLHLVGFVDDTLPAGTHILDRLMTLGSSSGLDSIIQRYNIEEIILTTSALSREQLVSLFKKYGVADSVNLRMSSGLFEVITTGVQVQELAFVPLVRVNKARLAGADKFLKLLLDYGLTIPGLILISPLLVAIAIAVWLDSPGPIIYRRRVMGVNGRKFDAFKFRTMRLDGDKLLANRPDLQAELAANHKLKHDPRITRIGNFLRRTSLDELPQLFNVLRREMSLVGPRMISPVEISKYNQWDVNLLTVPPGITGLWQVSGRSDVSYEERVRLDMHYIRNWTIWLDLELLFQTIPAVIKGRGAY
jgi:exopolysaccharide biosynthesis polyprenyl glycosylphosphotransferase